ncbi:hypothetical protein IE81DRAFT_320509 [Ceraceosorus guamensis]|uniref:F-box domain-containing protein n=1 Tax=Ceraceosorus guamensis TaxID=1522189 RepID=A0A316W616_9BASI|nr:hypothetical protein IE81DRAFT_320509 [Ceraceosorus guamensis]PWN45319.1 hypothetical protein IE81DRAFT_320509 [Ceraceosorus guamensis]
MDNKSPVSTRHHSKKRKHRHRSEDSLREASRSSKSSKQTTEEPVAPSINLTDLPIEILWQIFELSESPQLPQTSCALRHTFASAPSDVKAGFLLRRYAAIFLDPWLDEQDTERWAGALVPKTMPGHYRSAPTVHLFQTDFWLSRLCEPCSSDSSDSSSTSHSRVGNGAYETSDGMYDMVLSCGDPPRRLDPRFASLIDFSVACSACDEGVLASLQERIRLQRSARRTGTKGHAAVKKSIYLRLHRLPKHLFRSSPSKPFEGSEPDPEKERQFFCNVLYPFGVGNELPLPFKSLRFLLRLLTIHVHLNSPSDYGLSRACFSKNAPLMRLLLANVCAPPGKKFGLSLPRATCLSGKWLQGLKILEKRPRLEWVVRMHKAFKIIACWFALKDAQETGRMSFDDFGEFQIAIDTTLHYLQSVARQEVSMFTIKIVSSKTDFLREYRPSTLWSEGVIPKHVGEEHDGVLEIRVPIPESLERLAEHFRKACEAPKSRKTAPDPEDAMSFGFDEAQQMVLSEKWPQDASVASSRELHEAVQAGAWDIADHLKFKGVIPDLPTLALLEEREVQHKRHQGEEKPSKRRKR